MDFAATVAEEEKESVGDDEAEGHDEGVEILVGGEYVADID